jgi:hypothetical protein
VLAGCHRRAARHHQLRQQLPVLHVITRSELVARGHSDLPNTVAWELSRPQLWRGPQMGAWPLWPYLRAISYCVLPEEVDVGSRVCISRCCCCCSMGVAPYSPIGPAAVAAPAANGSILCEALHSPAAAVYHGFVDVLFVCCSVSNVDRSLLFTNIIRVCACVSWGVIRDTLPDQLLTAGHLLSYGMS